MSLHDAQRHADALQVETPTAQTQRLQRYAWRRATVLQTENNDERTQRLQRNSQNHADALLLETNHDRTQRLRQDAEHHAAAGQIETVDDRAQRLRTDVQRHATLHNNETPALRYRRPCLLQHKPISCQEISTETTAWHCNLISLKMNHIFAPRMFLAKIVVRSISEMNIKHVGLNSSSTVAAILPMSFWHHCSNTISDCRNFFKGMIVLPNTSGTTIDNITMQWRSFQWSYTGYTAWCWPYCFRIHGQIYYWLGPLLPITGQQHAYAQLYILDTAMAAQQRMDHRANQSCLLDLMTEIGNIIAEINPFVATLRIMRNNCRKRHKGCWATSTAPFHSTYFWRQLWIRSTPIQPSIS